MSNEQPTTLITEKPGEESHLARVSVRAWAFLILIITVCGMSVAGIKVEEPLYTLVGMAAGLYFGQKINTTQIR